MDEELLKAKVTGEVLKAYDQIIKGWVNDQIKRIELSSDMVTEERVEVIVQEALASFDAGLSEDEVRAIVADAIAESGSGSADVPAWISQVVSIDSSVACANVSDVNTLVWPGQDFSSKTNHFSIVFLGKTSGIHLVTRSPGGAAETAFTVILVNQPIMLSVRYDDLGAWVDIYALGARYSLRSLDSSQEYFEYNSADVTYYADYRFLPTTASVQSMINTATGDSITEARVQEMIDASVGAAIASSY